MIRRFLSNLYFLTFLNGFLLASLFYFNMEASYEKELFQAIRSDINARISSGDPEDSLVVKVMHVCHNLLVNRGSVFEGKSFSGLKSSLLDPTSMDLMTASGACGSYSIVLARILQGYHYPVRIAQMKANGIFADHNIVETKTRHGWVVLDPLFDVYFINPDHKLASFKDVQTNWNFYINQLPKDYDQHYRYEDVRYSNWTKIPIVMPAIKKVLDKTIGKQEADTISLRTYFLRKYDICFNIVLVLFLFVFSFTILSLIKAKVFPQKNIPVTFSNVYKYLRLRLLNKHLTGQGHA
jgi:hypothetical protein